MGYLHLIMVKICFRGFVGKIAKHLFFGFEILLKMREALQLPFESLI
uniref:Uncharacterized protein n=1 Tax=Rhizophora mucronata TaxID=61149 RepID=A0A2P2MZT4_RHIMU